MPYENLCITASPESSYEDPHLAKFTCTMLKIPCKLFFYSLHNCLINYTLRNLKLGFSVICTKLRSLEFEPQTWL